MMVTCPNDPKRDQPPAPHKHPRRAVMTTAEQHNLHEEPNRFIGRERELGELRASLLCFACADAVRHRRDRQDPAGWADPGRNGG